MTGQQKEERTCTLQDHLIPNKKEKKKGSLIRKKQVSKTTKENKNLQEGLYPHEDHIYGQRKMSKETNDLSKPFQERKTHRGKEKNH